MDLRNIGGILKRRIKEKGYTQEEFSITTGIGLSSLTKYMAGQVAYSIEHLEIFADKLECSYDYLLGTSLTPKREFHEIKSSTRLSEEAIDMIKSLAKDYDTSNTSKRRIDTLSIVISSLFLIERMAEFFYLDKKNKMIFDYERCSYIDLEDTYLLGIVKELVKAKP